MGTGEGVITTQSEITTQSAEVVITLEAPGVAETALDATDTMTPETELATGQVTNPCAVMPQTLGDVADVTRGRDMPMTQVIEP